MSGISKKDIEALRASGQFDEEWYLNRYPDVQALEMDPIEHYLWIGRRLRRSISKEDWADPTTIIDAKTQIENLLSTPSPVDPSDVDPQLRSLLLDEARRSDKKVSVIIPMWNRSAVVRDCIDSILMQSFPAYEIIICDDGSVDDSVSVVESLYNKELASGKIKLIKSSRRGVCYARNICMELATGNIFAYLDTDNSWHQDHLLFAISVMSACKKSIAYTALAHFDKDTQVRSSLCRSYDRDALLRANFIDINCFVHDRELYDTYGNFDQRLDRLVDWDLIIRYTSKDEPLLIPVSTVNYYIGGELNNITKSVPIGRNVNIITYKNNEEYVRRNILTTEQIEKIKSEVYEEFSAVSKNKSVLYIVVKSQDAVVRLSWVFGLDVDIRFARLDSTSGLLSVVSADGRVSYDLSHAPEAVYWFPDAGQDYPELFQLQSMFLAVATTKINIGLLSFSLREDAEVEVTCLRNQLMCDVETLPYLLTGTISEKKYVGKIIRSLPKGKGLSKSVRLEQIFGDVLRLDNKKGYFATGVDRVPAIESRDWINYIYTRKRKPTILAIPMKLAVGGVERNTIETIRELRQDYDFIYLTLEKIAESQGSVADQVSNVAYRLIDLAEITTHDKYLKALELLRDTYKPDLVWICNGSMWLCENALNVRKIFSGIPIVDQQVYDVEEGWIRRYRDPGIMSFDHFIAISSKIHHRFIEDFRIPSERTSIIYSMIDSERFAQARRDLTDVAQLRRRFDLPVGKRVFAFMARLTDQKRPLDFLALARRRRMYDDEHYVLVGDGVLGSLCEAFIQDHDLDNVTWIKNIPDTRPFWVCVDGLIVTSAYEGLPIVVLEALAMGKPVLATDVGEIGKILEDHQAGFLVPDVGDVAAMAAKVDDWKQALDGLHEHLQKESRNIAERFSAKTIARAYVDCWDRALALKKAEIKN